MGGLNANTSDAALLQAQILARYETLSDEDFARALRHCPICATGLGFGPRLRQVPEPLFQLILKRFDP